MSGNEQPRDTGATPAVSQDASSGEAAGTSADPGGRGPLGEAGGTVPKPGGQEPSGEAATPPLGSGGAGAVPPTHTGTVIPGLVKGGFATQTFLFVHAIWVVRQREALLGRPIRRVMFTHLQKESEEKGMRVVAVGGIEDHIHCLLQLMPSQNLVQVMRSLRSFAADWINESRLLSVPGEFAWEEGYVAYSVSPSGVKQMIDYIGKQEEYHKTKTLDSELEVIDRFKDVL